IIIIKQKKKIKTYLGLASRAPAITLPISPVHVMGPFSSLWAFIGRRWLLWAFLGLVVIEKLKIKCTLRKRRHLCVVRALFRLCGPSWAVVGCCGPSWACVGLHWPSLTAVGLRGPALAVVGCCGPSWACVGLRWPSLTAVGLCGPALAFVGRCWLLWAFL